MQKNDAKMLSTRARARRRASEQPGNLLGGWRVVVPKKQMLLRVSYHIPSQLERVPLDVLHLGDDGPKIRAADCQLPDCGRRCIHEWHYLL